MTCTKWILEQCSNMQIPAGMVLKQSVSKNLSAVLHLLSEKLEMQEDRQELARMVSEVDTSGIAALLLRVGFARAAEADKDYVLRLCGGADNLLETRKTPSKRAIEDDDDKEVYCMPCHAMPCHACMFLGHATNCMHKGDSLLCVCGCAGR